MPGTSGLTVAGLSLNGSNWAWRAKRGIKLLAPSAGLGVVAQNGQTVLPQATNLSFRLSQETYNSSLNRRSPQTLKGWRASCCDVGPLQPPVLLTRSPRPHCLSP